MLYNTHKKYGQVFGFVAMPLLVANELTVDTTSVMGMVAYVATAYTGAKFGAEFPDIDSATSKPAKKHPIIRKAFKSFGVKHRGKFSHDLVVQAIFWSILISLINAPQFEMGMMTFVQSLVSTYAMFAAVGVFSHLVADAMTVDGITIGFVPFKFMPTFIRKVNILGFKPFKKAFTTASAWNDMHYRFLSVVFPLIACVVLFQLFNVMNYM